MTNSTITTDQFDPGLLETLVALLDTMIPENSLYGAPSAGDEAIVEDVIKSMTGNSKVAIIELLKELNSNSEIAFHEMSVGKRRTRFEQFETTNGRQLRVLSSLLLQCYYRADKVLESLGMDARPPYPLGNTVEEGDWTLLEPVKSRGKIYRDV